MATLDDAQAAFDREDDAGAVAILEPLVQRGDPKAQLLLGTILTCIGPDRSRFPEGIELLRQLADAGDGHVAHNLGTALATSPPNFDPGALTREHYYQIAVDTGFEASVSSEPYWWKESRE